MNKQHDEYDDDIYGEILRGTLRQRQRRWSSFLLNEDDPLGICQGGQRSRPPETRLSSTYLSLNLMSNRLATGNVNIFEKNKT
jgi:hypothetical protein